MGEPAGIGTEITLKAWYSRQNGSHPYFLIDDFDRVDDIKQNLNIVTPLQKITCPDEAIDIFADALPVLHFPASGHTTFGKPSIGTARSVISSIEVAVQLALSGQVSAIVTNPIQKSVLYDHGFGFPGHTEFLGALSGQSASPVMMLACQGLRVVPVSVHVSLKQAITALTPEVIENQARVTWHALRQDFSIPAPRLAVAGLNPHAGEDGAMGSEENDIIIPAINRLRAEGMDVIGPLPPDTLFAERTRAKYDAAICMYHDQALIPIKALNFDHGVNITLGLPFVRTSPDHGTALDLAGKGVANASSLLAALDMASQIAQCRADSGE